MEPNYRSYMILQIHPTRSNKNIKWVLVLHSPRILRFNELSIPLLWTQGPPITILLLRSLQNTARPGVSLNHIVDQLLIGLPVPQRSHRVGRARRYSLSGFVSSEAKPSEPPTCSIGGQQRIEVVLLARPWQSEWIRHNPPFFPQEELRSVRTQPPPGAK